jgi:hypothetical protein
MNEKPLSVLRGAFQLTVICGLVLFSAAFCAPAALAQQPADGDKLNRTVQGAESDSDLAKKLQNPVSDLISVPFQNNFNFNYGPNNDLQYVLNIQPVIPIHLNRGTSAVATERLSEFLIGFLGRPPLCYILIKTQRSCRG